MKGPPRRTTRQDGHNANDERPVDDSLDYA